MNAVRCLSVLAGLLLYVTAQEVEQVDFDCVTQAVIGRVSSRDTEQRYSVSFQEDFFEPGTYLKVTVGLSSNAPSIKHLAISARDLVRQQPWGTWVGIFGDGNEASKWCETGFVMHTTQAQNQQEDVEVFWRPPPDFLKSSIEILVTIINQTDDVIILRSNPIRSKEADNPHEDPSEFVEPTVNPDLYEEPETHPSNEGEYESPTENPNAEEEAQDEAARRADELDNTGETTTTPPIDLHNDEYELQLAREADIRRQQQIRDEALASEGNWSVVPWDNNIPSETEEEEALEERWRQDEEKRRQIILWEIRDKEEHDSIVAQQEEDEQLRSGEDSPLESDEVDELLENGGSTLTPTVTSLMVIAIASLFLRLKL